MIIFKPLGDRYDEYIELCNKCFDKDIPYDDLTSNLEFILSGSTYKEQVENYNIQENEWRNSIQLDDISITDENSEKEWFEFQQKVLDYPIDVIEEDIYEWEEENEEDED